MAVDFYAVGDPSNSAIVNAYDFLQARARVAAFVIPRTSRGWRARRRPARTAQDSHEPVSLEDERCQPHRPAKPFQGGDGCEDHSRREDTDEDSMAVNPAGGRDQGIRDGDLTLEPAHRRGERGAMLVGTVDQGASALGQDTPLGAHRRPRK